MVDPVLLAISIASAALSLVAFLLWRRIDAVQRSRRAQHDLLYGLGWGETTTNNYGFAPSPLRSPERFQLQMYAELRRLLEARAPSGQIVRVLEISCGRGGGLAHLCATLPAPVQAVGIDFSRVAIAFCSAHYAERKDLRFAVGDALALPFADGSFDLVVNVEASNHFRHGEALFQEVTRVLRGGGAFLYADSRIAHKLFHIRKALERAGLEGELLDVTQHVQLACEQDTPRRLQLVNEALPWPARLLLGRRARSYAGVTGGRMYEKFRTRRRIYFMTCALKRTRP
jgi:SAM-dependent methyltransferase